MSKIALFPGTFDPLTLGHVDIIRRASRIFDKIYVGIGQNHAKKPMFSTTQRAEWIRAVFRDSRRVEVVSYDGLTIDFCKQIGAQFIIRGIRYMHDFEYEKSIADTNYILNDQIETIILTCQARYNFITSSIVRDIISHRGDYSAFVPAEIVEGIKKYHD